MAAQEDHKRRGHEKPAPRAYFKEAQGTTSEIVLVGGRSPEELVGSVFGSKYEILSWLGAGGMSVVYRALDQALQRDVAIKILLPQQVMNARSLLRFQQEARAASNLNHPGIVRIHDFGTPSDGEPFLVMEYVDGKTLAEVIKEEGHLNPDRAAGLIMQACEALGHAHKRGVIHRDLKPSNIMLVKGDRGEEMVRIVDFGIAKRISDDDNFNFDLTKTGDVFGSPLYMSPEQCKGQQVDARSDIYSLGCVFFEALIGSPPFFGTNSLELIHKHITETPASLQVCGAKHKQLHRLEEIVSKALAKDPGSRYQSMDEFQQSLESGCAGRKTTSKKPAASVHIQRKSAFEVVAMGIVVLAVLTAAVVWSERRKEPAKEAATVAASQDNVQMKSPAELQKEAEKMLRATDPTAQHPTAKELAAAEVLYGQAIAAAKRAGVDYRDRTLYVSILNDYVNYCLLPENKRLEAEEPCKEVTAILAAYGSRQQLGLAQRAECYNLIDEEQHSKRVQALPLGRQALFNLGGAGKPENSQLVNAIANTEYDLARESLGKERQEHLQRAIQCFQAVIALAKKAHSLDLVYESGLAENHMGDICSGQGHYKEAAEHFATAAKHFRATKQSEHIFVFRCLIQAADSYEILGDEKQKTEYEGLARDWLAEHLELKKDAECIAWTKDHSQAK